MYRYVFYARVSLHNASRFAAFHSLDRFFEFCFVKVWADHRSNLQVDLRLAIAAGIRHHDTAIAQTVILDGLLVGIDLLIDAGGYQLIKIGFLHTEHGVGDVFSVRYAGYLVADFGSSVGSWITGHERGVHGIQTFALQGLFELGFNGVFVRALLCLFFGAVYVRLLDNGHDFVGAAAC